MAMRIVTETPLVPAWQAEFWHRPSATAYYVDFPRHVSEALEKGSEGGKSFVFHLTSGEINEKEGDWSAPEWKKARKEDDPADYVRHGQDPAEYVRHIYLLDTADMRQTNLFNGCPRRIRRTYIEEAEYEHVHTWKIEGRDSPGR